MAAAYATMLGHDPGYGRFVDVSLGPDGQPRPDQVRAARERGLVAVRVVLDEPAPDGGSQANRS